MSSQNIAQSKGGRGQAGFTLIELMIVVAIIGILASVAVPQYKIYVDRAKITETLSSLSVIKKGVSEYILATNNFPSSLDDAGVPSEWNATYVQQEGFMDTPYFGFYIVMKKTGNTEIDGKAIYFFSNFGTGGGQTTALQWYCAIPGIGGFDPVTAKYVPTTCRNDYNSSF